MDTKNLKQRTEKLKKEINTLLVEYVKETDIVPDAVQAVAMYRKENDAEVFEKYQIDLGIRL